MTTRINGMAFDTFIGGTDIHVKSISLDISDESAVAKTRGIPDGKLRGPVSAEGEIEMSTRSFNQLGKWLLRRDRGVTCRQWILCFTPIREPKKSALKPSVVS